LSLNEFTNVTLNQVALDQTVGTRDLFLPDIGVSGSFRLHEYDKTYQTISCPTRTLDAYCSDHEIDRVHFIKADIEGAEWPMLKGGTEALNKSKPVLFLEIQAHSTKLFGYDPVDLFDWLDKLGYSPHVVSEHGDLVLLDDYRHRLPDHNFIFLPKKV
jgi:FkbM family methyltransferase